MGDQVRRAFFFGKRLEKIILELAKDYGIDVDTVIIDAVTLFKLIRDREKEGYKPALVKDGKATILEWKKRG